MSKQRGTPVEVRQGRRAVISTDTPDWIVLSGSTPTAVHIYNILNAHVNQRRGDGLSWPTQETLAAMVGLSRGDKVKPYTDELKALGAIDIDYEGMPRRCIYTIHEVPLVGYAGPMTVAEWYQRHREKAQVTPVTPSRGEQQTDEPAAGPVPPSGGEHVPPSGGEHATPSGGDKQPRNNNQEKTTPPPSDPDAAEDATSPPPEEEEADASQDKTPDISAIVGWFVKLRESTRLPTQEPWTARGVEDALATAVGRQMGSLNVAAQALRELVTNPDRYGRTDKPGRLLVAGDWWKAVQPGTSAARRRLAAEPRCQVEGHSVYPAERCVACMTDHLGPQVKPDPVKDAQAEHYVKAVRQRQRERERAAQGSGDERVQMAG